MNGATVLAAPLQGVIARYVGQAAKVQPSRRPGRPRKRDDGYFQAVFLAHAEQRSRFTEVMGRGPKSDVELYTWVFAREFECRGMRASHVSDANFTRSLKTFRNDLSEARRRNPSARD